MRKKLSGLNESVKLCEAISHVELRLRCEGRNCSLHDGNISGRFTPAEELCNLVEGVHPTDLHYFNRPPSVEHPLGVATPTVALRLFSFVVYIVSRAFVCWIYGELLYGVWSIVPFIRIKCNQDQANMNMQSVHCELYY